MTDRWEALIVPFRRAPCLDRPTKKAFFRDFFTKEPGQNTAEMGHLLSKNVQSTPQFNAVPDSTIEKLEATKIETTKLVEGEQRRTKKGDRIALYYKGYLEEGSRVFDANLPSRKNPFTFVLGAGKVIKGWEVGLLGMAVGEQRKLTIPPEDAYGSTGFTNRIPPNATLIFETELAEIVGSRR